MLPVARPQRTIPECPSNSTPQGVWMYAPRKHRALPVLAATLAAVAVSAAPAFAGSDGDDESPVLPQPPAAVPVQPAPAQPAPAQPAPVETESGGSGGSGGSVRSAHERSAPKTKTRPTATRRVRSKQVATRLAAQTTPQGGVQAGATTPQGGVQAGAGGMAEHGPDGVLLGLAGGALVLMASGGGLVARGRRGLG